MHSESKTIKRVNELTEQLNISHRENRLLKAQLVDAIGDGFYDGYLACVEQAKEDSFNSYAIDNNYVLKLSEKHESEHRYSKSINDIKAGAIESINVVDFVGIALRHTTIIGMFDINDVKDAFSYISSQIRNKSQGGAV